MTRSAMPLVRRAGYMEVLQTEPIAFKVLALLWASLGKRRVASVRNDAIYTNFYLAVDVVAWNDTLRQSFGVAEPPLAISPWATPWVTPSLTQAISHNIQINRITNEVAAAISPALTVALDTNKMYRMVFSGVGPSLTGRIYELPDIVTPIISLTATNDSIFSSGVAGFARL